MNTLNYIEIVLVKPKYAENIGSVCRAMKTMGLESLSLVISEPPDEERVRTLAVHAFDIMQRSRCYATLAAAVEGCSLVAGISRRRGKKRKYFALTPEELALKIHTPPARRVALVFGNEETGLSEADLACCHVLVKIPSSPQFPSLNLSHAVQILTYTLFRTLPGESPPPYTPIVGEKLEQLVEVITASLQNIGFFKIVDSDNLGLFFRDILARAGLSGKEARRLEVVFRKISGMVANKGIELPETKATLKKELESLTGAPFSE